MSYTQDQLKSLWRENYTIGAGWLRFLEIAFGLNKSEVDFLEYYDTEMRLLLEEDRENSAIVEVIKKWKESMIHERALHRTFLDKTKEYSTIILEVANQLRELTQKFVDEKEENNKWFLEFLIKKRETELEYFKDQLARFERYVSIALGHTPPNGVDLDRIKAVPIWDVLGITKMTGKPKRLQLCCPLHQETTPSFTWYTEQNSWYCFGCAKGGTIIDLYMAMHNVNVKTAIKELNKYI